MPILTQNSKVLTAGGRVLIREASPLDLPNLKLYLSATRMLQYANNTAIASFTDFSQQNLSASQATGSLQPLFKTAQFGVYAGVQGDGTDDYFSLLGGALDLFRNINQFTVHAVAKRSVTSTTSHVIQVQTAANLARFGLLFTAAGTIQAQIRKDDSTSNLLTITSNDTSAHFITATLSTANVMYIYLDGLFQLAINTISGSFVNTASSQGQVGANVQSSQYGTACINGISVSHSYSDASSVMAQYRGYLSRGYL